MADPTARQNQHLVMRCDDQKPYDSSPSSMDELSTFLATYTTPLHYSQPESDGKLFVFWSHTDRSQNNLISDDQLVSDSASHMEINRKIKSAFLDLQRYSLDVLIQFWSPVKSGRLTTHDQPFAIKHLDSNSQKHRLCSLKYQYNVDANKVKVEEDPLIIGGAPAYAFLNHLAEVVLDLRFHDDGPLVRSALERGFMSYFVMPICYPSQRSCVGVVECCAKNCDDLLGIFLGLAESLQAVGLSTFHGQEYLPYKTIGGLKNTMDEVEVALRKVCESHDLSLAQVSIAYGERNRVPCSSSLEDKPMLALKLIAPCVIEDDEERWLFNDHYGFCDMVPLRIGKRLARKAQQNYEPHFCKDIYEMTNSIDQLPATNTITKLSCLVICLRSIETNNLDYVFEFLWPPYRNSYSMVELLISSLKMRLPNFKFASGAELGDELPFIYVGTSSRCALRDFILYRGDFYASGSTFKRKYIVNRQGPKHVKRKTNKHKDQSDDSRANVVPSLVVNRDTVTIEAEYQGNVVKCHFPRSSTTFEAVEKEIAQKFKLTRGSFLLKFIDTEKDLVWFYDDDCLRDCLKTAKIYVENINPVRIW